MTGRDSAACEVKELSRSYGRVLAVDRISFSIRPGEVFGLIGPNGSGKTTTLRIIATLLLPSSGEVSVFGEDVTARPGDVRKMISYLPEDAGAYKNLSGQDYLRFMASLYFSERPARDEMVRRAEELADLGERIRDRVKTYSKGMTRKLLLGRALAARPKLAILDEPTSGMDVVNSMALRRRIREFADKGTAVLLSSHNMLEVEFLSDRVAMLAKGRIVESGTVGDIKSRHGARNLEEVFARIAG